MDSVFVALFHNPHPTIDRVFSDHPSQNPTPVVTQVRAEISRIRRIVRGVQDPTDVGQDQTCTALRMLLKQYFTDGLNLPAIKKINLSGNEDQNGGEPPLKIISEESDTEGSDSEESDSEGSDSDTSTQNSDWTSSMQNPDIVVNMLFTFYTASKYQYGWLYTETKEQCEFTIISTLQKATEDIYFIDATSMEQKSLTQQQQHHIGSYDLWAVLLSRPTFQRNTSHFITLFHCQDAWYLYDNLNLPSRLISNEQVDNELDNDATLVYVRNY